MERLPALAVSFLGFISPLAATALGYLVLDQTLTPLQLAGACAVVAAVVVAQPRGGRREPAKPSQLPQASPGEHPPVSTGRPAPAASRPSGVTR